LVGKKPVLREESNRWGGGGQLPPNACIPHWGESCNLEVDRRRDDDRRAARARRDREGGHDAGEESRLIFDREHSP
jgi:hypothetical protein